MLLMGSLLTGYRCFGPFLDSLAAFDYRYKDPAALLDNNEFVVLECNTDTQAAANQKTPPPSK